MRIRHLPAILLAVIAHTALGTNGNLCPNPGAEEGAITPLGWKPMSAPEAVVWDAETVHKGKRSLKIAWQGGATVGWISDIIPVTEANVQFLFSAWVKLDRVTGRNGAMMNVYHMDAQGKRIGQSAIFPLGGSAGTVATRDWRRAVAMTSLTPDVKGIVLNLRLYGASGTAWFDDFSLRRVVTRPLEQARPLRRGLRLTGAPLVVVASNNTAEQAAALAKELAARGAKAEMRPPDRFKPKHEAHDAIILGNLAESAAHATLYENFHTYEDYNFPGKGGYVLRPLIDPLGTGGNILVAGWSDEAGRDKALKRLSQLIASAREVLDTPLEVEPGNGCADPTAHIWRRAGRREMGPAVQYLLSGDRKHAEAYRELILRTWVVPDEKLFGRGMQNSLHLYYVTKTMSWDLMESCGVFSDEERARIANVLLKILRSDQGLQYVAARGTLRSRENHSTRAARAFYFGWRHFHKYYGELLAGETDIWRVHLESFWRSPFASARSYEDSISQHALGGSLDNTLDIAMMEPEWAAEWLAEGRARGMGERCLAVCNNLGECVLSGDTNSGDYPGSPFAKLSWILKDGRYQFMLGKRGRRGVSSDEPIRGFYAGVEPIPPADHLPLHIAPADKLFFQTGLRRTGKVKLEDAFDKLTIRSGFTPDDEYMLIDGTAGGGHSYDDANTICEYSANARRWLCQIDIFNGPTMSFHNAVTSARKGLGEPDVPQAAELVHKETLGEHAAYVATRLPEYNGMDWTRHVVWLKGRLTYVLDELTAREEDDYSCVLGWRSLGKPTLEPGRFTAAQDKRHTVGAAWTGDTLVGMISDTSGQHTRCIAGYNALFSRTDTVGQFVELKLPLKAPTRGRLEITTLDFAGRGIMQVMLNGESLGKPIDMFHPGVVRRTAHDLGPVELAGGLHTVRFQVVGRNPQSDNHNLGVLQLAVRKDGPAEETITPNRFGLLFPPSVPATLDRDTETLGKYLPVSPHRDQALNILEQSDGAHLEPGQSLCFQNVFYAAKGEQPEIEYRRVDAHRALVRWNGELILLAAGGERRAPSITSSRPGSPYKNIPREKLERMWENADDDGQTGKADTRADLEWKPDFTLDLPSPPLALESWSDSGGPGIAIGYTSGLVELRTPQGRVIATLRTGGAVHTLCATDLDGDGTTELLAGSDDEHVYALAADGTLKWKTKIPFHRKQQPWMWWTLGSSKVRKIHAADIDGDGRPEILVGAGNMRLQCLDNTGKELWRFRTDHGICDTITTADLYGEGTLRVIAGNGLTSDQGICRIFDEKGTQLQTYWNEGWCTSLPAVATADLDGDGKLTLFCGNNRGNLRSYPPERGRSVKPLWTRNLTRPIRSLTPLRTPQGGRLVVGSDSGTLVAFDNDGESAWTTQLGSAILATAETEKHKLVAGCKNGTLFLLDGNGTLRRRAHPFARLAAIKCTNGTLLAVGTTPPRLVVLTTR